MICIRIAQGIIIITYIKKILKKKKKRKKNGLCLFIFIVVGQLNTININWVFLSLPVLLEIQPLAALSFPSSPTLVIMHEV